jgi:hypothetical protein
MQTLIAGTTVTATLTGLKVDGSVIAAVTDPDTLACTIYNGSGQSVATGSVAGGQVTGDGAGNYTCRLTLPSQVGNFYLSWDSNIGGVVGKQTLQFNVRLR